MKKPIEIYVPTDLEDCFAALKRILGPDGVKKIEYMNCCSDVAPRYHFSLGMWLRNNWGLWSDSRLKRYFNNIGIKHPDDMTGIILTSFWRHLNHLPLKVEEQVKYYQDFWKNQPTSGIQILKISTEDKNE